ncbi:MAG: mechanosensitive ion channel [Saprospiraceae bacterium]
MDIKAFFGQELFRIGTQVVSLDRLLLVGMGTILLYVLGTLLRRRWLKRFFVAEKTSEKDQRLINRLVLICLVLVAFLLILLGLGLDFNMSFTEDAVPKDSRRFLERLYMSTIIEAFLIYFIARLVDEMLSGLLTRRYQQRRELQMQEGSISYQTTSSKIKVGHIVQPIVYLLALTFIVEELGLNASFKLPWASKETYINTVISAVLILLFTRLFLWVLTEIILYPYYKQQQINVGSQYAINRLLTYFILVIAVVATLQYIGINLTVLLGGAAALLVGVGLGLQQTFNDLICGIILLFERTVEVGDVVDMAGLVGTVKRIGLRTSLVETRDNVSVIVPNSKLVADNVVNWSHFDAKARFRVAVGVAYGSDTALVKQILLDVAEAHPKVTKKPQPIVRFTDFGDSALAFELLFWSRELMMIENVKSDLRFDIDKRFREAGVAIPFPQRDVWFRNAPGGKEG